MGRAVSKRRAGETRHVPPSPVRILQRRPSVQQLHVSPAESFDPPRAAVEEKHAREEPGPGEGGEEVGEEQVRGD